ncbi:hypothetical protein DSO57_1030511 [Entomophthora muscae]|uniref:Uncharacterized protein n=1 Tax=Entomophthora muscae TaxID=34485 RepID=A0ACC2TC30_9FUNG|nr:hypothetical protein DSO57_1030511 [Entomophthora muscae]
MYSRILPVFRWMITVYPIVTALTGFQVANLVPYFAKILPQLLGLYTMLYFGVAPQKAKRDADQAGSAIDYCGRIKLAFWQGLLSQSDGVGTVDRGVVAW